MENINFKAVKTSVDSVKDGALVLGFFKDKVSLDSGMKKLDAKLGGLISDYIKTSDFKAEKEVKSVFAGREVKHVVLLGLGEEAKYSAESMCNSIADISRKLRDSKVGSFTLHLDSLRGNINESEAVEKIVVACTMGLYKFNEFKTKDKDKSKHVKSITFATGSSKDFSKQLNSGKIIGDAVNRTRDVANTPPNVATTEYMGEYAKKLAKGAGIKCTVYDDKEIQKMKMECIMCVGQGSAHKPRLVVMEYNGAGKNDRPIALVGKGMTFDSGGLNIKTYPYMCTMKHDKAGATAVLHIMEACAKLKLPVNLVSVTPFCENMPDGNAYRPDDVWKSYNGTTVEIKNTDAEGRMILADALSFAAEKKPKAMIDLATLTGASSIVLGSYGTCFMGNDEQMVDRIKSASSRSLEKMWPLPLWEEYQEDIKSDVADLKHISETGEAGVIIGGTFLRNFVSDIPWVHVDIASTMISKADKGVHTKGSNAVMVRTMIELVRGWK
jgi:leucyl aminopeptidase